MTLPPERITIKRRREDEPVEKLYIEQKRQRSHYLWCRVVPRDGKKSDALDLGGLGSRKKIPGAETRVARRENAISGVPDLRVTLPSEDEVPKEASNPQKLNTKTHKSLNNDKFSTLRSSSRNAEASKTPSDHSLQRPRTFFLSASSTATSISRRRALDDFQDRTSPRNEPPVFVEGEKQSSRSLESHMVIVEAETAPDKTRTVSHESVEDASSEIGVHEAGGGCRLKPGQRSSASLEKQKRRDDSWVKPATIRNSTLQNPMLSQSASTPSHEWDYESMALAEELHQIALEETAKYAETQNDKCYSKQLKFKPKPPKERLRGHQPTEYNPRGGDVMDGVQYSESENEEFVYDTYVRNLDQATNSLDTSTLKIDEMEAANNRSIGIIVIGEHEEGIWETFGEEDESNKDWNSEEEDENAEDYYGNDYPEDEVGSDDEYGRGAYTYRKYGSDDEDFDQNARTSSDEEGQTSHPWKHNFRNSQFF